MDRVCGVLSEPGQSDCQPVAVGKEPWMVMTGRNERAAQVAQIAQRPQIRTVPLPAVAGRKQVIVRPHEEQPLGKYLGPPDGILPNLRQPPSHCTDRQPADRSPISAVSDPGQCQPPQAASHNPFPNKRDKLGVRHQKVGKHRYRPTAPRTPPAINGYPVDLSAGNGCPPIATMLVHGSPAVSAANAESRAFLAIKTQIGFDGPPQRQYDRHCEGGKPPWSRAFGVVRSKTLPRGLFLFPSQTTREGFQQIPSPSRSLL